MALRKKSTDQIKKALSQVDDKAEFIATEIEETERTPIHPNLALVAEPDVTFLSGKVEDFVEPELTINDFAKSFNAEDSDCLSLYDSEISLGDNCGNYLKSITAGLKEWEYKFLCGYACLPSMFCKILPIVEIFGPAGSGKSQLLIAIAQISGQGIISGQSTGASLKNHINMIRWADPETKNTEKNCLLLIDNLSEDSFKKEEYLSSFLNGYNRNTDKTFISNGKGENIEFRTFCGKMYTSIWDKTSTELIRRTITIRTSKSTKLDELLDPDDIQWIPLRSARGNFWAQQENWEKFATLRKSYSKIPKPRHSKEHWTLLRDVLISCVTVGVWPDLVEAVKDTALYLDNALKTRQTLLEVIVTKALEDILGFAQSEWESLSKSTKIHVSPRHLKNAIEEKVRDGLIDKPRLTEVQMILKKLNFMPGEKDSELGYVYKGKK